MLNEQISEDIAGVSGDLRKKRHEEASVMGKAGADASEKRAEMGAAVEAGVQEKLTDVSTGESSKDDDDMKRRSPKKRADTEGTSKKLDDQELNGLQRQGGEISIGQPNEYITKAKKLITEVFSFQKADDIISHLTELREKRSPEIFKKNKLTKESHQLLHDTDLFDAICKAGAEEEALRGDFFQKLRGLFKKQQPELRDLVQKQQAQEKLSLREQLARSVFQPYSNKSLKTVFIIVKEERPESASFEYFMDLQEKFSHPSVGKGAFGRFSSSVFKGQQQVEIEEIDDENDAGNHCRNN